MKLSEQMRARIGELVNQRSALHDEQTAILGDVEKRDNKQFTEDEQRSYDEKRAAKLKVDTEIGECEARFAELVEEEARDARAAETRKQYVDQERSTETAKVNEPDIYVRNGGNGNSFFRDLAFSRGGDMAAVERLQRHSRYMNERAIGNTNATGGSGGEWAPPLWLENEWINLIRPGAVTANLYTKRPMPTGVSSINIPKMATGTAVALQTTQNTALAQVDLTTMSISAGIATIGGKEVVSQQLLDQSAVGLDEIISTDLAQAYAQQKGTLTFTGAGTGTGTNSVINGLLNATIGNTVTWNQATPTGAQFYAQAAKLLSQFLTSRLMPPTYWVMHPRRWYWLESQTDGNGRPLVVPNGMAWNQAAVIDNPAIPMGQVGTMHGVPVVIDPLIPTTVNGGTGGSANQDVVYLLKSDDLIWYEGTPRAEIFREPYSDSLGVLFRLFNYASVVLNRHSESLGVMTGTGLATPAFAG